MLSFIANFYKLFKFIFSFISTFIIRKNSNSNFFITNLLKSIGQSSKMEFIRKLSGENHVDIILKKTLASIMKEDIHHKDRKNARKRNIYLEKREKSKKYFMLFVSVFGLATCLLILALSSEMTSEVINIIATAAGIFGSCLKDAYIFEFGSRSDTEKTYYDE